MIVVDTSALMAIVLGEADAPRCKGALASSERVVMSAATLAETLIVGIRKQAGADIATLIQDLGIEVEPLTERSAISAAEAYRWWGKERNPASLNYGDSFSYALAKDLDCPLLFVGADFSKTDLTPA